MIGDKDANWRIKKWNLGAILVLLVSVFLWPMTSSAAPTVDSRDDLTIHNDALVPPDAEKAALELDHPSDTASSSSVMAGAPGYYQTSDYLIGHVAVGLILPESDGSQEDQSENWTAHEIEAVQAEIQDALEWWASLEPSAHLTFTLETHLGVPIGYEPIVHRLGEERLWIGETLAALGFESENYFAAVRDYVNDLRDRNGADWAFAIFVVDSSVDADGRFADDYFAYAYIGGPFMVMTFDNSGYTVHNMDAVTAHEIGHVFRALDQYALAGVKCDYRAGYLNVENGNSLVGVGCESDAPSIMRGGISPYINHSIDHFARGQIGWWDSDGNGVLDPVDVEPQIDVDLQDVSGENDDVFSFSGQAWQEPAPSPLLVDVTTSYVTAVGVMVDGTAWRAARPEDGHFDTVTETFHLQVGPLEPGLHTLEMQAINSEGLVSRSLVTRTFVYDPVDGALTTSLAHGPAEALEDGPLEFYGVATAAYGDVGPDDPTVDTVQFRIDDEEWQAAVAVDGRFDSCIENFSISLTDLPDGEHHLLVRAVSSNGKVEINAEECRFQIESHFDVYLPMVWR